MFFSSMFSFATESKDRRRLSAANYSSGDCYVTKGGLSDDFIAQVLEGASISIKNMPAHLH